jgi:hypothetical protein
MKGIIIFLMIGFVVTSCENKPTWKPLFNGVDFSGWETYLGVPDASVDVPGMERNEDDQYTEAVGLNKDPLNVFSVVNVDGAPALRFSGEIFGSFSTIAEYENYHLRLEVKWGDKIWFPHRWQGRRNSGLLYHGVGRFGEGLGVWKTSVECQIMEGDFGDTYCMGEVFCYITAKQDGTTYTYDPTAEVVRFGPRLQPVPICKRNPVNEKPVGQWNTVELVSFNGTNIHIINGKVNMVNTNSHLIVNGEEVPLTKGVIQLQSEGAEVFFRNIEIRAINKIPAEYLK